MDKLIDWQLFSNNELIIDLKDVKSLYKENEYLEFYEDNIKNIVSIKERYYERDTLEYKIHIDFNNNICYFIIPNRDELSMNINGNIIVNKNKITVMYEIDEKKKIVIKIKD